jgi:hypothetical protein
MIVPTNPIKNRRSIAKNGRDNGYLIVYLYPLVVGLELSLGVK